MASCCCGTCRRRGGSISCADPRGVLRSYLWRISNHEHLRMRWYCIAGRNVPLFLACVAANWTLVNLACDLMARLPGPRGAGALRGSMRAAGQ